MRAKDDHRRALLNKKSKKKKSETIPAKVDKKKRPSLSPSCREKEYSDEQSERTEREHTYV